MRNIFILIIFLLVAGTSFGQVYISAFRGISIPTNPFVSENIIAVDTKVLSFKTKFPFGEGVDLGIGMGYKFSNNLSMEVDISTQVLTKCEFKNDWDKYIEEYQRQYYLYGTKDELTLTSQSLQLTPMLKYSIQHKKMNSYIKAGLDILYLESLISRNYDDQGNKIEEDWLYTGDYGLGLKSAFGIESEALNNFWVFAEINIVNMNFEFTKSEATKFEVEDMDLLKDLVEPKIEFEDDEFIIDFSNFGVFLGVTYYFGKK
jgi:hypothetical protein